MQPSHFLLILMLIHLAAIAASDTQNDLTSVTWSFPLADSKPNPGGDNLNFEISSTGALPQVSLLLCQIQEIGQIQNLVQIENVEDVCVSFSGSGCTNTQLSVIPASQASSRAVTFQATDGLSSKLNFFYCFEVGNSTEDGATTCAANSYSPLFNLNNEEVPPASRNLLATASALTLSVTTLTGVSSSSSVVAGSSTESTAIVSSSTDVSAFTSAPTTETTTSIEVNITVISEYSTTPTTTTTTTPSSSPPNPPTKTTPTSTPHPTTPPSTQESALATVLKISLGISIPIILTLLSLSVYFVVLLKKRERTLQQQRHRRGRKEELPYGTKAELPTEGGGADDDDDDEKGGMEESWVWELSAVREARELDVGELEAGRRRSGEERIERVQDGDVELIE